MEGESNLFLVTALCTISLLESVTGNNQISHEAVIYKANIQQAEAKAQNAQENEEQLFIATCFFSNTSNESW